MNYAKYYRQSAHHTIPAWAVAMIVTAMLAISAVVSVFWATHVVLCIKASSWVLLLFGIIVPPVGIIHGFAYWVGLL
jgi:hypothetical protein